MSNDLQRQEIRLSDPTVVKDLLARACALVDDIQHAMIASRDGLIIAADANGNEEVAIHGSALGAAAAGIGDHFTNLAAHGRLQSMLVEGDRGCAGVFPVSTALLLIVTSAPGVTLGRFSAAAKKVVATLQSPES
ncbi:hypothetical protein GZH49_30450 [Nocardia terpenica]|uniref:roadblock/LC7 domain-containing protein n=1 Tax=Nocardia terpenica TaxID=455432 RepID=UPI002FE27A6F